MSSPASWKTAGRCRVVLVEQPRAMSTAMAFSTAPRVTMSRGRMCRSRSSMTRIPACLASRIRAACTAGMVPLPGRATPMVSARQFMELAVNMPAQEPQPGQARSSQRASSSSVICPLRTRPTPSNTVMRSPLRSVSRLPGSMGPPDTSTDGIFRRIMAMSMPGTHLSQLGMKTSASKACARAMISMESAMNSRDGREKRMPSWFMAIPSHTAMAGNSSGVPPAMRTPALTASASLPRWRCPGTTSLAALTTPTSGRSISSRVSPSAYKRERCGAFSSPAFIFLLRLSSMMPSLC